MNIFILLILTQFRTLLQIGNNVSLLREKSRILAFKGLINYN